MSEGTFVDRAIERAQHNAWHEQARAEGVTYRPEPETWGQHDRGLVDKLRRELDEERRARVHLEERYAWLERTMNRLSVRLYNLQVAVNGPEPDGTSTEAERVGVEVY